VCRRGGLHVRDLFARRPDLDVAVLAVWMPVFPRLLERWALPGAVEELAPFAQFWDDERRVSLEVAERIVPDWNAKLGELPWDLFILFDAQAKWANAGAHVIGWGAPIIEEAELLDTLLSAPAEDEGER
jgi:hypothetical protein